MPASKHAGPRLRFKVERFNELAAQRGLRTDTEKAKFLDVVQSNFSRITRGLTRPSEQFVAACMKAFADDPTVSFDDLFEIDVPVGAAA